MGHEKTTLPIGILLPTRNSMELLPDHLAAIEELISAVDEVVVVDSSDDGTLDYVKTSLRHPNARILTHPPGLYESWNFGIGLIRSKYVYISTIGDSISLHGLRALARAAEALSCDVVVSPPRFKDVHGRIVGGSWPVHEIVRDFGIMKPTVLPPETLFLLALLHIPNGILGSSASNLYRTDSLKRRPFPVGFSGAGDSAWGVLNALTTRIGILPDECSHFLHHDKTYEITRAGYLRITESLVQLARDSLEREFQRPGRAGDRSGLWRHADLVKLWLDEVIHAHEHQRCLKLLRDDPGSWLLRPEAWRARTRRNRHRHKAKRYREVLERTLIHVEDPRYSNSLKRMLKRLDSTA